MRAIRPSWVVLICIAVGGCNAPVQSVVTASGRVDVGGQPLSGGVVTLEPISPTTGPNASAPVFAGKFDVPATAGLHGGTYRVRVSMIPAEIRETLPTDQGFSLPPENAVIAPAFDADSRLTCELIPDQQNVLAFEVAFLK